MRLSRSVSLRALLAVALSGMAVVAVLLSVVIAGREVRRLNYVAADERLALVAEQLSNLASRTAEQRRELLLSVASDSVVVMALRGEDVDPDALVDRLSRLRGGADAGLPIELRDRDGRVVFSDLPAELTLERPPARPVPLGSAPAYGAFHSEGDAVLYYSTAPVTDAGERLGWIAQRRRVGSPGAAEELQHLIGQDARVYYYYEGDSIWVTLAGAPVTAPLSLPPPGDAVIRESDGERTLVRARGVEGIPWYIVVEMSDAVIADGARGFMARMLGAGVFLILAGVAAAVLLSQRLTRGLRRLAQATDRVAAGDYAARVDADAGSEEMDRVAAAFNSMATQVAASHDELEARLREARTLTEELSEAHLRAEEARLRAEAADRAKSDFLATMSHEIRTPINAVLGFNQVLELDDLPDATRRDYLKRSQRAARQLAALVDDVLDLSKIQSGNLTVAPRPAPVQPAVDAACALVSQVVESKRMSLDVSVEPDLVAHADPQRLEQVLLNLLANAVKFTPEGGQVSVHAALRKDGTAAPRVEIAVTDSGIGIDPDKLEEIFEPFVQGHSGYTREFGGTGLGLSISRRLARLMDGDIVADSAPGSGSRFTLVLPAVAEAPSVAWSQADGRHQ
ncbi:MAG TPA: ATP-binding protein [Longimicrobiales bacterium]|nr:ATP-binding protein [Longimicrobiales bacterium]